MNRKRCSVPSVATPFMKTLLTTQLNSFVSESFTDSFHKDLLVTVWTYSLNSLTHSLLFPSVFWTSSKFWDLCFTLRIVPAFLWNLWSSSILLWFKWHHLFCKFIIFTSYFFLGRRVEVLMYLCINLKITYTKLFHSESSINSLSYYY